MFNFTRSINILGNMNCYLTAGDYDEVIYMVTFRADGTVESYVTE